MKTKKRLIPRERSNLIHFRFLGLKSGECRPHVIRSAAKELSNSISENEMQYRVDALAKRRYEVALATYRLLDPRRRPTLYERVHLSISLDEDNNEIETRTETFAISRDGKRVVDSPDSRRVQLMNRQVIEEAIHQETKSVELVVERDEVDSWLEERREVVRAIRDADGHDDDNADDQPRSAFQWLRSKLGLQRFSSFALLVVYACLTRR